MRPVPVVICGLGAIGTAVARAMATDPGVRLVGAVDPAPGLAGEALAAHLRTPARQDRKGISIARSLGEIRRFPAGTVLLHTAGSSFKDALPLLTAGLDRGLSAVSSCEELLWPWHTHPRLARRLDRAARHACRAILATGVNPGFVMDLLPAVASAVCRNIRHIHVVRRVDVASRRRPLQRKVGVGLTVGAFRARARRHAIGHAGLEASARWLAHAIGWELDTVTQSLAPVTAGPGRPRAGTPVHGQTQKLSGRSGGREVVRFELTMALGTRPQMDEIRIKGTPPVNIRISPGTAGDEATVSSLLNGIRRIGQESPGLVWRPGFALPHGGVG
ncbi:MAG: dihydrodipicolinate reductase [Acidobacteriota bacterium]